MKRRDFMKMAAVAPAGMVGAEQSKSVSCPGRVKYFSPTDIEPTGCFAIVYDDKDAFHKMDNSAKSLWGAESNGRKTITTIYKDGYGVRFVK